MKCPNCGTENRDEVRFCRKCGNGLSSSTSEAVGIGIASQPASVAGAAPAAAAASAAATEAAPAQGVTCPACGADAKPGSRFCPSCGQVMPNGGVEVSRETPPAGQTQIRMASPASQPRRAEQFTPPKQPVPPVAAARSEVTPGTTPPGGARRRLPKWLFWAAGILVFLVVVIALAWFLLGLLSGGDAAPSATAAPTAAAEQSDPAPTPSVEAAIDPELSATAEAPPAQAPPGADGGMHVELDAIPDAPRVGETFVVAAILVSSPGVEATVQAYDLQLDGTPQLRYTATPLLSSLQSIGTLDDLPRLFVFEAAEAGQAQLQIRVTVEVTGEAGSQEVLSPVLSVTVQQ